MEARGLWRLVRIAATFLALLALWFLFSASASPGAVAAGIGCSALIALVSYGTFIEEHEAAKNMVFPRPLPALAYPLKLVLAMYVASFKTFAAIVTGSVSPRITHFRSRLKSDIARVALAEAITFTPGTISLELDEDHFIVHWLVSTTRHAGRAGEEVKGSLEAAIKRIWV